MSRASREPSIVKSSFTGAPLTSKSMASGLPSLLPSSLSRFTMNMAPLFGGPRILAGLVEIVVDHAVTVGVHVQVHPHG